MHELLPNYNSNCTFRTLNRDYGELIMSSFVILLTVAIFIAIGQKQLNKICEKK